MSKKWNAEVCFQLSLYIGICIVCLIELPNSLWNSDYNQIVFIIGILGIWRYSWWLTHVIRAYIYAHIRFPTIRRKSDQSWRAGWRPGHLHFMMTTYKENRAITEKVILAIVRELRACDTPATLWLGSGDSYDESVIRELLEVTAPDINLTMRIVRQNQPGKRLAIGLVLRAMKRRNLGKDDLVVFMDGDFILASGCLEKSLPLFAVYPDLQALTTNEEVICLGPRWIGTWLSMRFAQRRIAMQSHSLSNRVLTLTGRMSVFRAHHLMTLEFVRLLEADHLDHWLWGEFRFLSGDDKSTWYYLLKKGACMLYVPDALGYTVEIIEGNGMSRMLQNFLRWSGNMLRTGSRAISLGPRAMPLFIWWCLVDQRLSMWTMLVSPVLALLAAILLSPLYLISYLLFIAVTRLAQSMFLFAHSQKVEISYPLILYLNQLFSASIKIYCLFHLSKQRWSNRGNQSQGIGNTGWTSIFRNWMAAYLTVLSITCLSVAVLHYSKLIALPDLASFRLFVYNYRLLIYN